MEIKRYFIQAKTKKFIAYCDSTGTLLKKIPLGQAYSSLNEEINGVAVINRDTAIAFSILDNGICWIDSTGRVVKKYFLPVANGKYIIDATCMSYAPLSSKIYVNTDFTSDYFGTFITNNSLDSVFTNNMLDAPSVLELGINHSIDSTFIVKPLLQGIQRRFKPSVVRPWHIGHEFDNDGRFLYYISSFQDSIYKIDPRNNVVDKAAQISSDKTKVGMPTQTSMGKDASDESVINYSTKGIFSKLLYDRYSELLFATLYHEVPENSKEENTGDNRAWSLLIFNKDLVQLAEIPFEAKKYEPATIFSSSEGIWVRLASEKNIYQLFTFKRNQ